MTSKWATGWGVKHLPDIYDLFIHTVDGSEIRRSPVEVGSFSHYLQGFCTISGGCLGLLPSTVCLLNPPGKNERMFSKEVTIPKGNLHHVPTVDFFSGLCQFSRGVSFFDVVWMDLFSIFPQTFLEKKNIYIYIFKISWKINLSPNISLT